MSTQALQVSKKYKIAVDKMPRSSGIHRELPLTTKEGIYYRVHFAEGNRKDKEAQHVLCIFSAELNERQRYHIFQRMKIGS